MGYAINQVAGEFFLAAEDFDSAIAAAKTIGSAATHDYVLEFRNLENLEEILSAWRFQAEFDETGNITELWFTGENAGDQEVILTAIAPWVGDGSYLQIAGEDGSQWRYQFSDGQMETKQASINFDWELNTLAQTQIFPR